MSNQGNVQASVRTRSGVTAELDWNGDWHYLWDQESIPAGTFNERMLAWINTELSASHTNLPGAMQAYAESLGFYNWSSMTAIAPGGPPVVVWEDLTGNVSAPGNGVLLWSGNAAPSGARVADFLGPNDFDIRWLITSAATGDNVFLGLSATQVTEYDQFDEDVRVFIAATSNGRIFAGNQENNTPVVLGSIDPTAYPKYYRVTPSGSDIILERSATNSSWQPFGVFEDYLDGVAQIHIYCFNAGAGSGDTIQVWAGELS